MDDATALQAIQSGTSFNAVHLATAIKIDLFVAGSDPFEHERLRCREARQGADLDRQRMPHWAERLGVSDLLER